MARYKHYVELVEPSEFRACIKCCDDAADCPTNKGTLALRLLSDMFGSLGSSLMLMRIARHGRLPGCNLRELL